MKLQNVIGTLAIGPGNDVERILREDYKDYQGEMGKVGILNVAHDYDNYQHPKGVVYLHCGLIDGPPDHTIEWHNPNMAEDYVAAALGLDYLMYSCDPVFVHCHSGVSRSCIVVAIYISVIYKYSLEAAIEYLSKRYERARINPGHLQIAERASRTLLQVRPGLCRPDWREHYTTKGG